MDASTLDPGIEAAVREQLKDKELTHEALGEVTAIKLRRISNVSTLTRLPKLRAVSFEDYARCPDLAPLQQLPALRHLTFRGISKLRDLRDLPVLPWLRHVRVDRCPFFRQIHAGASLRKLLTLTVERCKLLERLTGDFVELQKLRVRDAEFLRDLSGLAGSEGLQEASIEGCWRLKNLMPLEGCLYLQNLELRDCREAIDLNVFRSLTRLEKLTFGGEARGGITMRLLASPNDLDVDTIREIYRRAGRHRLARFFLRFAPPELAKRDFPRVESIAPLDALTRLRDLQLYNLPYVTDLRVLGQLPALRHLEIWNLSPSDLVVLGELSELESLSLGRCGRANDLSPLLRLKKLRSLVLKSNSVPWNVPDELRARPDLKINEGRTAAHRTLRILTAFQRVAERRREPAG